MSQLGRSSSGSGAAVVETLTGNTGGPVGPDGAFNINVLGDTTTINVAGNAGTNTLTISAAGGLATTYTEDSGSASPSLNNLNIFGGTSTGGTATNINTFGSGNTVQVRLNNSISQPNTSADQSEGMYSLGGVRFMHNYGVSNTFLGAGSANLTLTSTGTVAIGSAAGFSLTDQDSNTIVGSNAGFSLTSGLGLNTIVGSGAAISLVTGSINTIIGVNAGNAYTSSESRNILINNLGVIGESDTIRIGDTQTRNFQSGIHGVTPPLTRNAVLIDSNGQLGSSTGTNGQVLIGATGSSPAWNTLTAGTGISITNAANSITIAGTFGIFQWTEITGTSQAAAVGNGYIANNAGLVTVTLPAVFAVGDVVRVMGKGAGLFALAANTGDTISSVSSTTSAGGAFTAQAQFDAIEVVGITANSAWGVLGFTDNFTIS